MDRVQVSRLAARVLDLEPAIKPLERQCLSLLWRFGSPSADARRGRVLNKPDAPGRRVEVVDIARVLLALRHGKCRVYRHPDELNVVVTQQ